MKSKIFKLTGVWITSIMSQKESYGIIHIDLLGNNVKIKQIFLSNKNYGKEIDYQGDFSITDDGLLTIFSDDIFIIARWNNTLRIFDGNYTMNQHDHGLIELTRVKINCSS